MINHPKNIFHNMAPLKRGGVPGLPLVIYVCSKKTLL